MSLTEAEIRAIARDEFKKLLIGGIGEIDNSVPEYLPTAEAWKMLGFSNPKQLLKAIENGLFRLNKEVQDRRGQRSQKARYYFNIKACLKRLNTAAEKRTK
ncbi:MAG: hypothetical protein QNJ55_12365 [Xenococcus sp. MO_188.B8]|nr:hypothetical protein [Xenococcus sp. MO_188.B8]